MAGLIVSEERRKALALSLTAFYEEVFDETPSDYQVGRLLDFFLRELGPPAYNQGVQDARAYMLDKLDDIEGDVHEPDDAG